MSLLKNFQQDKLEVKVFDTRQQMGAAAGEEIATCIKKLLEEKQELNIIFAAAPSQNEVLETLCAQKDIPWNRIHAFHMDEYVGLPQEAPQGFGNFLRDRIFSKLPFASVNYINGNAPDREEECARYTALLEQHPVDIVCMGVGENAHIAFNDPGVADFQDKKVIKIVALDEVCRQQQVNDGCFATIDDVPKFAFTLTVPTLFSGDYLFCSVPAATKANAVYDMIHDTVNDQVPATILREHDHAILYCDKDSGAKIL